MFIRIDNTLVNTDNIVRIEKKAGVILIEYTTKETTTIESDNNDESYETLWNKVKNID